MSAILPAAIAENARFTSAEFQRLVRSGGFGDMRVELRRGVIVKMNAIYAPHAKVRRILVKALEAATAARGWIVDPEVSVEFGAGFEPVPDIVVWDPTVLAGEPMGPIPGAAVRLVVEIADTSLRDDLGPKLEEYAGAGLSEYWVADVKGASIVQHGEPIGQGFARRETHAFGAAFEWVSATGLGTDTAALRA